MASLYNIDNHLQGLINEIEENSGEVSEETLKELEITQEELNKKLTAYCQVIQVYKNKVEAAKSEKKRINDLQNVRKNVIERMKNYMLDAVQRYGYDGKSGNKVVELDNFKIYTTNKKSIIIDEERNEILHKCMISYIIDLTRNGILETGDEVDLTYLLEALNQFAISEYGEDFEKFTMADLKASAIKIECSSTLFDLFKDKGYIAKLVGDNLVNLTITDDTKTEDIKFYNAEAISIEQPGVTIAKEEINTSLTIK